jgi:hypothetical protein
MQPLYPDMLSAPRSTEALEAALEAVERHLAALGAALRDRDADAIESHAAELHRALAGAIHRFSHASRDANGVPPALRRRLALAGGRVAAQRESLARATAALDRAIDVLMPPAMPLALYDTDGHGQRPSSSGFLNA